jgi:S-adenosylmethionine:tRNA ribosyltransferase-isomerase
MEPRKHYFDKFDESRYKLEDFEYKLPPELIAQYPLEDRDSCRLLLVDRASGKISHHEFLDILKLCQAGDCLVFNNTRVFPARLFGQKDRTGATVEVFLLRNLENNLWEVLVKPARKIRIGNKIMFGDTLTCDVVDNTLSGGRIVEFNSNGNILQLLEKLGNMPLPPYIKRQPEKIDHEYYQTVYALKPGAVAAPTAGLHFTQPLMKKLEKKGLRSAFITLHIGLGTFRPVKVEDISRHRMDSEYYEVDEESSRLINQTKKDKGRIIAVGTTSVRVLETLTDHHGFIRPAKGWTDKFIFPPYEFRVVDALLTNFHLPASTLIMMVSAFSSVKLIKKAYQEAIKKKYRFFSYGDAMLII